MRYRWLTIIIASFGLVVSGCDSKSKDKSNKEAQAESPKEGDASQTASGELPFEATGTVAVVDGTEIGPDKYNDEVRKMTKSMPGKMPYAVAKRFHTRVLDRLVDKHLIETEIEKAGIEVTDKEIQAEFDRVKERLEKRIPEGKDFQWFLDRRQMSEEDFKQQISKQLRLEKLLKKKEGISVSDAKAKKYYQNHKKEFEKKERVKARQILIKTGPDAGSKEIDKAKKKAQKIAEEARSGKKEFAAIAKEKSEGRSAGMGGDLGYLTKDSGLPFIDKLFGMKSGDISEPYKTDQGFHILQRGETKPAETTSFEDAKEDIVQKLERKQLRNAMKTFVKDLRKKADVKKNPDNIKINVEKRKRGGPGGPGGAGGGLGAQIKQQLKKKAEQKAAQQEESGQSGGSSESGESGGGEKSAPSGK